ncbi:MAG: delta-aminolevulinic acid dehydratase HemB [Candidatus Parcubacteria bacterium]|jgi:porphobilinogen synthase
MNYRLKIKLLEFGNKNNMKYIACLFLKEGITERQDSPMVDVDYHTLESGLDFIEKYLDQGIKDFLVFGSTDNKSVDFACEKGLIIKFIKAAKEKFKTEVVIHADVGLSPYSVDGHSTVIENGHINFEKSYALASKLAVAFAGAGADYVAPCLSLYEQVQVLRGALDTSGYTTTKIHAYSSKFSSSLYGPYRETIQSPLEGKDKKTYQTDYSNPSEALDQIVADESQGASIVMVKPAMMYLDIVYRARQITKLPLSVYHVSGEYSMIKEAGKVGIIDENEAFDEIHSGFARCKVDYVIGYAPDHFLRWKNK